MEYSNSGDTIKCYFVKGVSGKNDWLKNNYLYIYHCMMFCETSKIKIMNTATKMPVQSFSIAAAVSSD